MRRCGVAGILLVCAAGIAAAADLSPIQSGLDYHSFANTEQFRVTHLELNLRVDFTNQVLIGVVALEIKRLDPTATELVLDTRDLDDAWRSARSRRMFWARPPRARRPG